MVAYVCVLPGQTGCSALYFAAREGFVFIVKELLAYDANVNITSLVSVFRSRWVLLYGHLMLVRVDSV